MTKTKLEEKPAISHMHQPSLFFNDDNDEILLDELIRRKVALHFHIKLKTYAEIAEKRLPQFTPEQCKNRWYHLRKSFSRNSGKRPIRSMSKAVYDKLEVLIGQRAELKIAKTRPGKFWNEANDLRLLDALAAYQPNMTQMITAATWTRLAETTMPKKFTAKVCKLRLYKLRRGYQEWKTKGSTKVSLTQKVYDKMCAMYAKKNDPEPVPDHNMCRCCGQIADDLIDLEKEARTLNWYLHFTGLNENQLLRPFTKICKICDEKLDQAQRFREMCLLGAEILQKERPDPPTADAVEKPIPENEIELNGEVPPEYCLVCESTVASDDFAAHMREHAADKSKKERTCHICQKTFQSRQILRRHTEYHIDGTVHKCETCRKRFICKGDLRRHMKIHKSIQPNGHLCTVCGRVFELEVYLRIHMSTHTGIKKFQCPHCPKKFARKHGCEGHIRSCHENVRYQCEYCELKYIMINKLKMHTVLKHQGAKLRCNRCDFETTIEKSFRLHLSTVHKEPFKQSVHVILGNGEKLLSRRRKMLDTLVQTEKMATFGDEQESDVDQTEMENC